ncbi:hypothetical protein [Flavobacterium sinopsychrotolerans]|nr:hypothetical protein [Flavobacterium sinopsychrotolerans]
MLLFLFNSLCLLLKKALYRLSVPSYGMRVCSGKREWTQIKIASY